MQSYKVKSATATATAFSKTNAKPNTANKFCQICKNAGLTEKEYTNHFVKNQPGPHGVVVCPTILNAECTYCFKKGHVKSEKHCSSYRKMILSQKPCFEINKFIEKKPLTTSAPKQTNYYDILSQQEDEYENEQKNESNIKPVFVQPLLSNSVAKISYASVLKTEVAVPAKIEEIAFSNFIRLDRNPLIRKSWIESDSDTDSECD